MNRLRGETTEDKWKNNWKVSKGEKEIKIKVKVNIKVTVK